MSRPVRITQVDGSVLADCLYLIGQALVKLAAGDDAGGNEDLAAAERLVPAGGIRELLRMVSDGELPAPGPDPDAMDAWLEVCRMAGAGELVLIRILSRPRPSWRRRSGKPLFGRLDELRAAARAADGGRRARAAS